MKKVALGFGLLLLWLGQLSFTMDTELNPPIKSINKAVKKIWKTDAFEIIRDENINCNGNGCWYKLIFTEEKVGQLYIGRVNSCKSGGCEINTMGLDTSFEYFDYMLFTDDKGVILWVKIFNYQATQGHEVMSRGWLNQFKGMSSKQKIEMDRDVESISGATVSANAITVDIQNVLGCAF